MGIAGLFVKKYSRPRHHPRPVVIIRDYMQQLSVTICGCSAVTEKSLIDLIAIDGKRFVLGAVRPKSSAVLIDVLVAGRLIHIPDTAIAGISAVDC
ncbi:hypothetical protein ES703_122095 [subsurface metagenome]